MPPSHPYAQMLGDRDPMEVLAETQQAIPALLQTLSPEGWKRSYAPGKWTAAQVLAHLADSEIAFGFRVRQILSEPALGIQTFDQDHWAQHYASLDGLEAARTFQAVRGWNLSLFRLLNKADGEKTAQHPERGPESVETVIRIIAGHTVHHLAQLQKIAGNRE